MSVFKCKMCGGDLNITAGDSIAVCEYCGTKQTLPKLGDERRANLYDRANHFRRNNEFDKAISIYEQILNEDASDAEAYWSLVLCRYGIEYVEDPATHRRMPTVNRAQFTSVFDDEDYKSAVANADSRQREVYESEAQTINEIHKGILAISQREEPFDVFICYKETDSNGRRTQDSVLANDLYHQLTQEGFKVFFSRITLEDKLGQEYEPYIFAALNSAKVMVVLGTKPEFFNAVWVRNEWNRYLALIKSGAKKVLIPAYRDMDPYDIPEEFSHLQAQDMSKLGFMQDLIRGIRKLSTPGSSSFAVKKEPVAATADFADIAPLLKRVVMFLEDGDFARADDFCEQVLNQNPECAEAYLGKLMAELQVRTREGLRDCREPFDGLGNYQKMLRFGDEGLKKELEGYIEHINTRNENERLEGIYNSALFAMNSASQEWSYKSAADGFGQIAGYKDADVLKEKCLENAEISRKDTIYYNAAKKVAEMVEPSISMLEDAISTYREVSGWRDVDDKIAALQRRIEKVKAEEEENRIAAEKRKKRNRRTAIIATPIVCTVTAFLIVLSTVIIPTTRYNSALALYNDGKYDEAMAAFETLDDYKDSVSKFKEIRNKAIIEKAEVGATLYFGSYEQDNDTSNGKEDIEWLVRAKEGNKALIISKYCLDCQPYNTEKTDVTWETCTLRKWLNETFLNAAFSREEQEKILLSKLTNPDNSEFGTDGGNDTTDKVFLLSKDEAYKYFNSDTSRCVAATEYAKGRGIFVGDNGNSCWCIRSPGIISYGACRVSPGGRVDDYYSVSSTDAGVRPALWLNP